MGRETRGRRPRAGDPALKLAVTGATGYVGRHVAAELDRRGIPAMLSGRAAGAGGAGAAGRRHSFVSLDMKRTPEDVVRLLGEADTVIHLAWEGLPNYKSARHVDEELPAQYDFLERLIRGGVNTLLVSGTCLEYGMRSGVLHEELPAAPTVPYAVAKDTLRRRLQALQREQPFELTWARLFYSYGDGQSPTSLLPQLRAAVARGEKTFKMSGGAQLRDYLSAEEQAGLLVSLATNRKDNGVVNVCSGKPVSVRELVESWIRKEGWSIELDLGHYPYPDYEPMEFWGDRAKLDRCLSAI